jgi:hypothetical protein
MELICLHPEGSWRKAKKELGKMKGQRKKEEKPIPKKLTRRFFREC